MPRAAIGDYGRLTFVYLGPLEGNLNAPTIDASTGSAQEENTAAQGDAVATFVASDLDGDDLTYSITSGNVTSVQSVEIRLAQNYYQRHQHFIEVVDGKEVNQATETFDFSNRVGRGRTDTSIEPLLNTAPIAAAPQKFDREAQDFMFKNMGVASEDQNLLGFMHSLSGVTNTTAFLGFGGHYGNKEQAENGVTAAQSALALRGRYDETAVSSRV